MNVLLLLPILVPMLTGGVLATMPARAFGVQRVVSVAAALLLLPIAASLVHAAAGGVIHVAEMGNWPAPFGIVLQLDRLSAMMLMLTAVLATASAICASRGDARLGRHFDALFQFQLMGLNGAFLAGDMFNLFVFFEILLIASYALLLHGGGRARVGAGLHYVLINLAGSAFFLVALGILYGLTGTLNMVDMGLRLAQLDAGARPLAAAGGVMLLLVFLLKAALFPLYFWLPRAYASAAGSVAALFAIMTKVGVYAVVRTMALVFGAGEGMLAGFMHSWVWWMALVTMALGAVGAMAERRLSAMTAYFVLTSVGLLCAAVSMLTAVAWSGALYYLLSTTLCTAALFLVADALEITNLRRAPGQTTREPSPTRRAGALAALLFLTGAVAAVGMPPLSGFIGKAMIMRATPASLATTFWPVLLVSSLLLIVAAGRTGTRLLWSGPHRHDDDEPHRRETAAERRRRPDRWKLSCAAFLLAGNVGMVLFAGPVSQYLDATAAQLLDRQAWRDAVLPYGQSGPPGLPGKPGIRRAEGSKP